MTNFPDTLITSILESASALKSITLQAGRQIMDVYAKDFSVMEKQDSSPLTEADLAAHRVITDGIAALPSPLSKLPLLSEEGEISSWEERRNWMSWWLIDPLDGTKEFVKRNGEFTVNIAFVTRLKKEDPGIPIAGWVYAPVPDILFEGIIGQGASRVSGASIPVSVAKESKTTRLPAGTPSIPPRIVASRSHRSPETDLLIEAVARDRGEGEIVSSGSSLKLCRVAEGSAEFYPRCAPTMEWDTAAADAVCRAAGARVVQADTGKDLEYGKENLLNPWFLVSADESLIKLGVSSLLS